MKLLLAKEKVKSDSESTWQDPALLQYVNGLQDEKILVLT